MRVLFLIRSLHRGGAEQQLVTLANGLKLRGHLVSVAVFYSGGSLETDLDANVGLYSLDKRGRWDVLSFTWRLWYLLWSQKPDTLHSYLPIPNILAVLSKPIVPGMRVIWGIRSAYMDLAKYGKIAQASYWLESKLSRWADAIIFNSHAGQQSALCNGFVMRRAYVILNGIDTDRFRPDREAGRRLRAAWGVDDSDKLIGLVARLDPMKDHPTFLKAAALVMQACPHVRYACVGGGPQAYQQELNQLAVELGISAQLLWIDAQDDMPAVYNALDILCSSSYGEGFSNVIAEAMACGVPCVVTDVGDSAWIVGDAGETVPARDATALALGLQRGLAALIDDSSRGERARRRIEENASVEKLIDATEAVLWPSA